jgi:DNA excision repair protein ERCC-4
MIVQDEQDGKSDLPMAHQRQPISTQAASSTRLGGMTAATTRDTEQQRPLIVVDMREFRSELPSLLHKRGMRIEPCTVEVGDYVLTPTMVVERKSINDLIESLANGRLYNQVNQMTRAYKTVILLIEFDANKPFVLHVSIMFFSKFPIS